MNQPAQDQPAGNATPTTGRLISNAPFTLNGSNYVRVCWNPVAGATGYDVLRTTTSGLPNGAASIGVALNTAGNCVSDQGAALSSYTLDTYNPAKTPTSLKYARFDMPGITPPLDNPPAGQCRIYVDNTRTNASSSLGAVWAIKDDGDDCFPAGTPGPPGPSVCTDLTQVTNLYVNWATGNDTTGDGTSGLPWKTIQHAIDEGIPGIVCGRYIIHMQVAATYVGAVRLDGRIFAGGGGFADDAIGYPIVNTTPDPDAYSWVEIRGDTANASTYIIQEHAGDTVGGYPVTLAGGNLTIKGVTIRLGAFGVHATKGAFVNLAGVKFENNSVGVMGTEGSVIHIDNNATVDDGGTASVLITNNNVGGVPYTGVDAIEVADGSFLTDFLSDGNNTDTGAIIHYDKGAGTLSIACIEMKYSSMYFRGEINCEVSGIVALSSNLAVQTYDFNGNAPNTGTALSLRDSIMSGQVFGGGLYTVTNAANAVRLQGAASISPYPNIVSATTPFIAEGGDTIPANVRSRDTFMSTAHLIDTVTFSASPAFNMNTNGSIKKITLTADVTSSTITSQRPGENMTFIICQDGAGSHTFAWPANVRGEEAIGATLSTCSTQQFVYDQGAAEWLAVAPMVKNQ
jgi:hypothetical protein